jgi:hypothetical protein
VFACSFVVGRGRISARCALDIFLEEIEEGEGESDEEEKEKFADGFDVAREKK